jgi:hypothetical protein
MMESQGPTENVKTKGTHVGFDVLTAVVMKKKTIFWDIMPISSSSSSSSSAKQPFLSHILPYKILSDCIRFSLLWISQEVFSFYRARSSVLRQTPNLEQQVSVFMPPSDRVAQLYLQAPVSLFVAFYNSQGYGGGILSRLHAGYNAVVC